MRKAVLWQKYFTFPWDCTKTVWGLSLQRSEPMVCRSSHLGGGRDVHRIPGAFQQAALWGDELYSLEVAQWLFLWSLVQPAAERAVSLIKKPSVSLAFSCPAPLVPWGGRWEPGAPLRWCFSVFCEPLLPSLPPQSSLCLAMGNCVVSPHACQMKLFFSLSLRDGLTSLSCLRACLNKPATLD